MDKKAFDSLSAILPTAAPIKKPTHIWIIEWLPSSDERTGQKLHQWMEEQKKNQGYPFRSVYRRCSTKEKVLDEIDRAAAHAEHYGTLPLIHLEAHGSEDGLSDKKNALIWNELVKPLQKLNCLTRYNLTVMVAACKGFEGFRSFGWAFEQAMDKKESSFSKLPVAPAVVIAGPVEGLGPGNLLSGTKEFYRQLGKVTSDFNDIISSSTIEAGCDFRASKYPVFLFESWVYSVIIPMHYERNRLVGLEKRKFEEKFSRFFEPERYQHAWDAIFMVDSYPENRKRFGVNWSDVFKSISGIQGKDDFVKSPIFQKIIS
ncbi:MAG: hypothetical protein D3903_14245 [Candidatus Electrothrix sp. GM3_4]|nr:hypothetical protein [Candidatus Electrothrix sp. GM3_4]